MSEYVENTAAGTGVGQVEKQYFTFADRAAPLIVESGRRLGPVTLAYETYGSLDERASNAVLVLHALTGDSHAAGFYDPADAKPGWWDIMNSARKSPTSKSGTLRRRDRKSAWPTSAKIRPTLVLVAGSFDRSISPPTSSRGKIPR